MELATLDRNYSVSSFLFTSRRVINLPYETEIFTTNRALQDFLLQSFNLTEESLKTTWFKAEAATFGVRFGGWYLPPSCSGVC
jgi:hypothetical protein